MTDAEIHFIMDAIELTVGHWEEWKNDYAYDASSNEYIFKGEAIGGKDKVEKWFDVSNW